MTNGAVKGLTVIQCLAAMGLFLGGAGCSMPAKTVWLSELDLSKMTSGLDQPRADRSIKDSPLSIAGRSFEKGVGVCADSLMYVALDGGTSRFSAFVGVDDEAQQKGSVCFKIYGDEKLLFDSDVMKGGQEARAVDIQTSGMKTLLLVITNMGDGTQSDYADWAEARFEVTGAAPTAMDPPAEKKEILTPAPGPAPRLNNPAVFGTRPGNPFLFRIPATGTQPMSFSVEGLPESLKLDPASGIITGHSPKKRGEYPLVLTAKNSVGQARRPFKLIVGDKLALTPPMGWNSWYIHASGVTDAIMREAAEAMVASGMADFGYMYVNIDDGWSKKEGDEPYRDSCGTILTNEKFPDMAAMTEYIHGRGLRAGLYTSPGPLTCGKYVGSYQYEQRDAQQFAKWGFDFLKHDRCSYSEIMNDDTHYEHRKPYALMGEILQNVGRDVVYNLCQYGMGSVWEWGDEVGGQVWRTDGDIGRMFFMVSAFRALYARDGSGVDLSKFAGPGNWNDPDYILIGEVANRYIVGLGEDRNRRHHNARDLLFALSGVVSSDVYEDGKGVSLTPNQQYQYMSLWSLMAAPLIFSGDMTRLDEFTLNVLCNAEVIAVNQDELGRQGVIVRQTSDYFVIAKPLAEGSLAVGVFSTGYGQQTVNVSWKELGIKGRRSIRDLWRQRDVGSYDNSFETTIPRHGVMMVCLTGE